MRILSRSRNNNKHQAYDRRQLGCRVPTLEDCPEDVQVCRPWKYLDTSQGAQPRASLPTELCPKCTTL